MTVPLIEFVNVTKRFGEHSVLDGVNLSVFEGDITTIIGKSGVGKSVLLKHIVGLLEPDSGDILFRGTPVQSMRNKERGDFKRRISYMFQNNALFDSLSVFENIALPLREKTRLSEAEVTKKVMAKAERLELAEVTAKYPSQISGGMKKRVALARALITEPTMVLFDEPTTGLDPIRKNAVLGMIHHYQKQFGFTAVIVSHNIPDILYISNRVAIIDLGKILFQGTPIELEQYESPVIQEFLTGLEDLKDDLTGLETKRHIERRLDFEMSRFSRSKDPFSIVLFTIEHLDEFNEHVGHISAQQIIQSIASVIIEHFGARGTSGRYKQNEILTVLPHTRTDEADKMLVEFAEGLKNLQIFRGESYSGACYSFSVLAGHTEALPDVPLDRLLRDVYNSEKQIAQLECSIHGKAA